MSLILRGSDCFKPSQQSCIFSPALPLRGADAARQEDWTGPLLAVNIAAAPKLGQTGPFVFLSLGTHWGLFFFSSSLLGWRLLWSRLTVQDPPPTPPNLWLLNLVVREGVRRAEL